MAGENAIIAWEPDQGVLRELVSYLEDALNPRDHDLQMRASMALTQARLKPDTPRYLAYLLFWGPPPQNKTLSDSEAIIIRSSAAINLKNIVKSNYKHFEESTRTYVRTLVVRCIENGERQIRNLAGTVITEIVHRGGIAGWPDLLPELLSLAANDRGNVPEATQSGSMNTLVKLCEDNQQELDRDYHGQRPLQFILSRLLQITTNPIADVRANAISCINSFVPQKSETVIAILDAILERLFILATDADANVRRNVCRSLVLIVDIRPDKIIPHMQGLVEYLCAQQRQKDDPDSALEAAEFWLAVGENDKMCSSLEPYLKQIIPVLLDSMVYDEDSVIRLSGDVEDADLEDRPEDIRPRFAASKENKALANGHKEDKEEVLSEGEIEDDAFDDDIEAEEQWTLRKCSAAALDVLASNFHRLVFEIALDYLNKNLTHSEWPYREAAVLAMGAVAEGCLDALAPALPNVVPYLITLLNDREPAVRVITCWALGRYSLWAISLDDPQERRRYFEPMLNGILDRMLDKNKRVQTAAASAFANLGEKVGKELVPHTERIIKTFVNCFEVYKTRNMYVLYDCVQTLADQIGASLRDPVLLDLLMPALINRWNKISDQSQELFPLHECLSYIAAALGNTFAPFATPTFNRSIRIIHRNLEQVHLTQNSNDEESPDKDFLVTSLDLISAIIQAVNPSVSSELVQASEPRFFELLLYCLQDSNYDVRQSAYALLGDCAVNIFSQLRPSLPSLISVLVEQLDMKFAQTEDSETAFSVINNACWSCGEIAMKYQNEMNIYAESIYTRLKKIIDQPGIPVSVGENAAIAIGRLGVHCAVTLGSHLGEFVAQFLHLIEPVETTDEKADAFLGLNRIIRQNPFAVAPCLLQYLQASLAYNNQAVAREASEESINDSFRQVLEGFKSLNPDYFNELERQLTPEQLHQFKQIYNL